MPAIFDINEYEYMIIETEDGKQIAKITADGIDVSDDYRVRMKPNQDVTIVIK